MIDKLKFIRYNKDNIKKLTQISSLKKGRYSPMAT